MAKNPLSNVNTDAAVKSVGRENAEKLTQKMFRVNPQQEQRIREAMFYSGRTLQDIVTEGIELWIAENLKGKM